MTAGARSRVGGCVAGGTLVHTEQGLLPAARLARMRTPPRVAAFDHINLRMVWDRLAAVRMVRVWDLREVRTEGRRSLWCTPDHPVFVIGRGYVPVRVARPGVEVIAADDPPPPMGTREFRLPGGVGLERTRPASRAGAAVAAQEDQDQGAAGGVPLPLRRRDWIAVNRAIRTGRLHAVYDFHTAQCQNFLADGLLVRHQ